MKSTRQLRAAVGSAMLGLSMFPMKAQFNTGDTFIHESCWFPFVADVDSNGSPDLILHTPGLESVRWMANNGSGAFGEEQLLASLPPQCVIQLAASLDGDQDIDLVYAALPPDSAYGVLRCLAPGTYQQEVLGDVANASSALDQLTDLDGDGRLDLLSLNTGDEDIWFRNVDDSAWQLERISHWCLEGAGGTYVALDVEGDGDQDLLSLVELPDDRYRWAVYWDLGGARFGPYTFATDTLGPYTLRPGQGAHDVNGDGLQDLVFGGRPFISFGNGTFSTPNLVQTYPFQQIANIDCGAYAEAVLSGNGQTVRWRRLGDPTSAGSIQAGRPVRAGLADLDMDGRSDLLLGSAAGPDSLEWRRNDAFPDTTGVTLELSEDTITSAQIIFLSGGAPPNGGAYSGEGVFNDSLYGFLVPGGWTLITYNYLSFQDQTLCGGSAVDSIYVVDVTGMAEAGDQRMRLFPNPCGHVLRLVTPTDVTVIGIMDVLGRPVAHSTSRVAQGTLAIELDPGAEGGYHTLTVRSSDGTQMTAPFLLMWEMD